MREKKSVNDSDDEVRGYVLDQIIDKNLPFKRTKKQILNEPNHDLSDSIKPPYPILKKKPKKEMQESQFKKFMEILNKI